MIVYYFHYFTLSPSYFAAFRVNYKPAKPGFFTAFKPGFMGLKQGLWFSDTRYPGFIP